MGSAAEILPLIEALLFVSEKSISLHDLASFLPDYSEAQILEHLTLLTHRHATGNGGLQVEEIAGGFRLTTHPDLGESIKEFFRLKNRHRLSRAALETMAIIAYKQPVTHPEIQEIRRVSAEGVLKTLLERRLIKIAGRRATVGKPMEYKTTRTFLEYFGLASLEDLPPMEEFGQLLDAVEARADPDGPPGSAGPSRAPQGREASSPESRPWLEADHKAAPATALRRDIDVDGDHPGQPPGARPPQASPSNNDERSEPPPGTAGETLA